LITGKNIEFMKEKTTFMFPLMKPEVRTYGIANQYFYQYCQYSCK